MKIKKIKFNYKKIINRIKKIHQKILKIKILNKEIHDNQTSILKKNLVKI